MLLKPRRSHGMSLVSADEADRRRRTKTQVKFVFRVRQLENVIEHKLNKRRVWVNGDLVNHGTNATASSGNIALQAEGSEVEFRKTLLTPITSLRE